MTKSLYKASKSIDDYSGCARYDNGELVDPAAYAEWRRRRSQLETLKVMGWSENEIEMK